MTLKILDFLIYWFLILLPFLSAIAPAPANVAMGVSIVAFLVKRIIKKQLLLPRTAINWPLLFLFLITCISIVNSIDIADTLRGGIGRLAHFALLFFVVKEEIKDKKHLQRILVAITMGICLTTVDGIWQIFTGFDFIRKYEPMRIIGVVRATASFKDPNTFGIFLASLFPLLWGVTRYYQKGRGRMFWWAGTLVGLIGVAATYSRPALLAVFIAVMIMAIVRNDKIIITVLAVVMVIAPFIAPKSVKDWAREAEYNPIIFMCNLDRIAIYRHTFNMIKAHPVIGVGANTYMDNYKDYKEFPEYRNVVTSDYLYAHNNFLHMAAEIGLVGLGIFIWLLALFFRKAWSIYKKLDDRFLKAASLSLFLCIISFLVNGLTESSLYSSRVAIIFWYLLGATLSLTKFTDAAAED
ncbi:MAG: O-antigen ligase family protein [Candidatus Omnitrophica bacterium]|nr:O-antigen ligase family protein [Candidatus Omnitrophota bacterium]